MYTNIQKLVDKIETEWYNNKAVTDGAGNLKIEQCKENKTLVNSMSLTQKKKQVIASES